MWQGNIVLNQEDKGDNCKMHLFSTSLYCIPIASPVLRLINSHDSQLKSRCLWYQSLSVTRYWALMEVRANLYILQPFPLCTASPSYVHHLSMSSTASTLRDYQRSEAVSCMHLALNTKIDVSPPLLLKQYYCYIVLYTILIRQWQNIANWGLETNRVIPRVAQNEEILEKCGSLCELVFLLVQEAMKKS